MPIGEFVGVAEVLRGGGYRPTRVRPWAWQLASGDAQDNTEKPIETLIASVFVRDGLDWKIDLDVSKSDLPTKDVPAIKDGYMIVDLAALPNANDKSPRFVALWVALTDASNNRRVLVDLTEEIGRAHF